MQNNSLFCYNLEFSIEGDRMKKLSILLLLIQNVLFCDEGMWPMNMVPYEEIATTYGVQLSPEWIEHVQKSCLRFSSGGSSSFISPDGLLMTNHHVGSKAVYSLSSEDNDLLKNGFYAPTKDLELSCPNIYADQLIAIRDVTAEVLQDIIDGMSYIEQEEARKASVARICKEALEETGLQPEVVGLYRGAFYHLYLYKRYTDVRLVMAPEQQIAYFGGDQDNFEFPRHSLDVCFFRVYENNEPVRSNHYLRWSKSGPVGDEPLFVAGHPGRTERLLTSDHLKFIKNVRLQLTLQFLNERIENLERFSDESEENRRIALQEMHSLRNSQKVYKAIDRILKEGTVIRNKEKFESELFRMADNKPWMQLQEALTALETYCAEYYIFEQLTLGSCHYYDLAESLVRASVERQKPNEKRLREFRDSELPILELRLFSEEPLYPSLEKALLIDSITRAIKILGKDHPQLVLALGSQSIEEYAEGLVSKTLLGSIEYRKRLYEHPEEVLTSTDPFIQLVLSLEPYVRALRDRFDNEFSSCEKECYAQIANCLFQTSVAGVYPDATFTLRLSVGTMKGCEEIAPFTAFDSAYRLSQKYSNQLPYRLSQIWLDKEDQINKQTPFNFISTNDIIGGNSGSPIINKDAEVVGIIFDGNRHAFVLDFAYDDTQARAVSVHSQAIIEALSSIYDAKALVSEIKGVH